MSNSIPKKWERTAKAIKNKYKGTNKRVELITGDRAFVLSEGDNSGDYIEIVDDDDQIEIVVEG